MIKDSIIGKYILPSGGHRAVGFKAHLDLCIAAMARVRRRAFMVMLRLEYRFLSFLPAVCAKPMRWMFRCNWFLRDIHEDTTVYFFKLILGFCLVPLGKFSDFLFKFLFCLNKFGASLNYRVGMLLYGDEFIRMEHDKLRSCLIDLTSLIRRYEVACGLDGREKVSDFRDSHT